MPLFPTFDYLSLSSGTASWWCVWYGIDKNVMYNGWWLMNTRQKQAVKIKLTTLFAVRDGVFFSLYHFCLIINDCLSFLLSLFFSIVSSLLFLLYCFFSIVSFLLFLLSCFFSIVSSLSFLLLPFFSCHSSLALLFFCFITHFIYLFWFFSLFQR